MEKTVSDKIRETYVNTRTLSTLILVADVSLRKDSFKYMSGERPAVVRVCVEVELLTLIPDSGELLCDVNLGLCVRLDSDMREGVFVCGRGVWFVRAFSSSVIENSGSISFLLESVKRWNSLGDF